MMVFIVITQNETKNCVEDKKRSALKDSLLFLTHFLGEGRFDE